MKISTVSQQTGLSTHTIRYYEKQGLVHPPAKDVSGHRYYTPKDVELLNWVACLKKSGMPLSQIKTYVQAFDADDQTALIILEQHLEKLQKQHQDIEHYLEVTAHKIQQLKNA